MNTLNEVYLAVLKDVLNTGLKTINTKELIGCSYSLTNIDANKLTGHIQKTRKLDYNFCRSFANSIIMGDSNFSNIKFMSERAKQFANAKLPDNLPANFSLAYGARIKMQEANMLKQLKADSRRAIMHIWHPDDYLLLDDAEFKGEFACTSSLQFFNRGNKLHQHVHMRSSNAYSILPIDIFNFTELQKHYADLIGLEYGNISISFGSLHIFERDLDKVIKLCTHNIK